LLVQLTQKKIFAIAAAKIYRLLGCEMES